MYQSCLILTLLAVGCLVNDSRAADPPDNWQWRNPLPTANSLSAIAHGNGRFVVAGEAGVVMVSENGSNWNTFHTGVTNEATSMVFANGRFVVVGNSGSIVVSSNGMTWSRQNSGTTNRLTGVTYGAGSFVAVGANGIALTSPDAETWTLRSTGVSAQGVAYGNGLFVAPSVSVNNASVVTSPDGASWTPRTVSPTPGGSLGSIVFANGIFIGGGYQSGAFGYPYAYYWSSTNGMAWEQHSRPFVMTSARMLTSDTNGLTLAIILGGAPGQRHSIEGSLDGRVWTTRATNMPALVAGAYGGGQFVLVGSDGAIATSSAGSQWSVSEPGARGRLTDIAFGNGVYVGVGSAYPYFPYSPQGGNALLVSTNGRSFAPVSEPVYSLSRVIFDGGAFIAVGGDGIILRSIDGIAWQRRGSGTFNRLNAVARGGGMNVAVGDNGTIVTSPDGLVWSLRFSPTSYQLNDVRYGNGRFVAVGYFGTILSSADGISWSVEYSDAQQALFQVAYGNDRFVAVGEQGRVLTSSDGATWTAGSTGVDIVLRGLAFGDGTFVAAGSVSWLELSSLKRNTLLSSSDGINWVRRNPGTSWGLFGARFLNDSFWITGENGVILESGQSAAIQLSSRLTSGGAVVELTSAGGRNGGVFHLQRCTNGFVDHWSEVLTFTNTPAGLRFSESAQSVPRCFYRLVSAE